VRENNGSYYLHSTVNGMNGDQPEQSAKSHATTVVYERNHNYIIHIEISMK